MNASTKGSMAKFLAVATLALFVSSHASALTIYKVMDSPAVNTWTTSSIGLSQTAGWRVDSEAGSTLATQAQVQYVLGNLSKFYIRTEWKTGSDDTNVDSIHFGSGAVSNFDSGNDGWRVVGLGFPGGDLTASVESTGALGWDSGFGNPSSGSVRVSDVYPETWIAAPNSFLGNQSARYGETLTFDMFIRYSDSAPYGAVALTAPNDLSVPEPESYAMLLTGLGLLGFMRRFRKH